MNINLKKILRALSLELRHTLEGYYDPQGAFHSGDLERRLNELGVWRERPARPLEELLHLSPEDKAARQVIDAYIAYRLEAEVSRSEAVAEFVRESAYTWANRLFALRCMEARGIIDEVILQKEAYGRRSLAHHRLARRNPEACAGPDEGLFAALFAEFAARAAELPELFDPEAPAVALRPSLSALKRCIALLSGTERLGSQEPASDEVFTAPDALGWAYQYWNSEEKDRVFEKVRTQKGAKIEGSDIIPATQLYTEPYMVKFLVQNSLGALWMSMHPESRLADGWEYYVKDADRNPVELKPLQEITFLDPAAGSGHFLLEAFDLFYQMYKEEVKNQTSREASSPTEIAASILNHNLFAIDIDGRAIQIAIVALWMKAREYAPEMRASALTRFHEHLVATDIHLPKGKDHLRDFLGKYPEAAALRPALETIFEGLQNVHELGSLVKIEEPVEKELRYLKEEYDSSRGKPEQLALLPELKKPRQGELPLGMESYGQWKTYTLAQLKTHFSEEAEIADLSHAFFGQSAQKGLILLDLLTHRYDVIITNPPYLSKRIMASPFRDYLKEHYKQAFSDLYTVFIYLISDMTVENGYFAVVSLSSYLSISTFEGLRKKLLFQHTIQVLADLGPFAFEELRDHVEACLLVCLKRTPKSNHQMAIVNLTQEKTDKGRKLLKARYFQLEQSFSYNIPGMPIAYRMPKRIRLLFETNEKFIERFHFPSRSQTGDDNRFVRFLWEVPVEYTKYDKKNTDSLHWITYTRGGEFEKWLRAEPMRVLWTSGARYHYYKSPQCRWTPTEDWFKLGVTYTSISGTTFNARILDGDAVYDNSGPALIPLSDNRYALLAWLNSKTVAYILRLLNPTLSYQSTDIGNLPFPSNWENICTELEEASKVIIEKVQGRFSNFVTSVFFDPYLFFLNDNFHSLLELSSISLNQEILRSLVIIITEAKIEALIFQSYDFDEECVRVILGEEGKYPPSDKSNVDENILTESLAELAYLDYFGLYRNSRGVLADAFSFIACKNSIHPDILHRAIASKNYLLPNYNIKFVCDYFGAVVLRLLGHRWPKQIESDEPMPDWADGDGIIPLTPALGEQILLERVRKRIADEIPNGSIASIEREFEGIVGESLEKWLNGSFFKRHISQFKKRPIAWQLSSTQANGKKRKGISRAPAFSCLVYYHKLDADLLPKLRTQYVGPLRQRYETELRTLDGIAFLTADQAERRIQLGVWIYELRDFEARLESVTQGGFASPGFEDLLASEPLDNWTSRDGRASTPETKEAFLLQEQRYDPDLNDGVRVNIAPLQKVGLLAANVLDVKDLDKAIAVRAEWRADERRWCREGKLPKPGWWK